MRAHLFTVITTVNIFTTVYSPHLTAGGTKVTKIQALRMFKTSIVHFRFNYLFIIFVCLVIYLLHLLSH